MKRNRPWQLIPLTVAALALAACSNSSEPLQANPADDVSGSNSMQSLDLDVEYGGLAYSDEAEGFADAQLVAEAERESDDELTGADADPYAGERRAGMHAIWVKIAWGRLDGRPVGDPARAESAFESIDWSGTASVDTGMVVLKRTLWFEYPRDHRLPRDSRRSFGWVSHTGPHKDGILFCILTPPGANASLDGELTFATGPLTQSFSFADLRAGLDLVLETGIEGNSVSIVSGIEFTDRCPGGFLAGYWQQKPEDARYGGWFRARVLNQRGDRSGYLLGRFGINAAGEQVFAGKLIGLGGHIRGLVAGHYELADEQSGSFEGRWVNRAGTRLGTLKGRFRTGDDGAGHMQGIWAQNCRD